MRLQLETLFFGGLGSVQHTAAKHSRALPIRCQRCRTLRAQHGGPAVHKLLEERVGVKLDMRDTVSAVTRQHTSGSRWPRWVALTAVHNVAAATGGGPPLVEAGTRCSDALGVAIRVDCSEAGRTRLDANVAFLSF